MRIRIIRNCKVSAELVSRPESFTPQVHRKLRWQNYRISGEGGPRIPAVFKGPLNRGLSSNERYDVGVQFVKGRILDHWEIRFYPPRSNSEKIEIELRYLEVEKEEEVFFKRGKPLEVIRAIGRKRKGILYFLPIGTEPQLVVKKVKTEVLFRASVIVQIRAESETRLPNAVKMIARDRDGTVMEIYDRRENRFSPFAVTEQVRKTIGKQEFEFWNLWEFNGDRNEIRYLLTESGLQKI